MIAFERVVIDGLMYKCPIGTSKMIDAMLAIADTYSHENYRAGIAHNAYNEFLDTIKLTYECVVVSGVYKSF